MKGKMRYQLLIGAIVLGLLVPAPSPARATEAGTGATIAACVGYSVLAGAFAYFAWRNRPSQQEEGKVDWSPKGPGGFYVGGFMGGSLVSSMGWGLSPGVQFTNKLTADNSTSSIKFDQGVVGGLKFGYFCHQFPYVGLEGEFNFTRNDVRRQQVTLSVPVQGTTQAFVQPERFYVTTLALKIMGRYGFLPDKEVPFGRLQPYVGIGPGFVVVYGDLDSAKNFSLEVQAGVRYMLLKYLSAFVEYKFSQQWGIELEHDRMILAGGDEIRFKSSFDYPSHKIVVGLALHFF